ncbi:MAG: Tryptophan synthase alpha chain, partial [Myxococcales bacterium]|nr:Tryptophan synthase alpha chain [Myxococcales bacterium]
AIPIDGGEHVVRVTAPGRVPFTETLTIGKESDAQTVAIPVLTTPVPAVTPPRPAASEPVTTVFTAPRLRWGGIALAGAGVIALGAAGYVLSTAIEARDASNADCWVDGCDKVGVHQRSVAVSRGNLATLLGVGGVVLVGAGATSFYVGRRLTAPDREARISMRVMLEAAPGVLGTGIQGQF